MDTLCFLAMVDLAENARSDGGEPFRHCAALRVNAASKAGASTMMKRLAICSVLVLGAVPGLSASANADEYVRGYYRKDGTYVAPYYRSSPDDSYNNNWSVRGNRNPYTGQEGTRSPTYDDRSPYPEYLYLR